MEPQITLEKISDTEIKQTTTTKSEVIINIDFFTAKLDALNNDLQIAQDTYDTTVAGINKQIQDIKDLISQVNTLPAPVNP